MTLAERPTTVAVTGGAPPKLAEGVELIGEFEGSGFKEPPSLLRRADGQVIQLPPLLYSLVKRADGTRDYADLANEVGEEIRRKIEPDQVRYLLDEKIRPLGVLAEADGSSPEVEKPDPFLALRLRTAVFPERVSGLLGSAFRPLFWPPLILLALAAFVAADVWLFFYHGVAQALRQSIQHPGLFLPLFLAVVVFAAFHEVGHAAACRYGGGHPGKMGCGIYLAWPAFYTDVTDTYRLGRGARLRTDLGGVYFNVVICLATFAAYAATHAEPVLLLVLIEHFEIVHQLLPVIRLDGYYIVSDLTGVPDLFARIGPILASLRPRRAPDPRVTALKRWVRVAVTAWVVVVVPLLLLELLVVLIHLPRLLATAWTSGQHLWDQALRGFRRGDVTGGVTDVVQVVVLAIPIVGILLVLLTTARRGAVAVWRSTGGRPVLRIGAVAVAAAGVTALLYAWVPAHNYQAIRPGERGTVAEGVGALRHLRSEGPLYSEVEATRRAAGRSSTGTPQPAAPGVSTTSTSTTSTTSSTVVGRRSTETTLAISPGKASGSSGTGNGSGTATTVTTPTTTQGYSGSQTSPTTPPTTAAP